MKYVFHPYANEELDKAVGYYEGCQVGLGLDFAEEVYAAIARIRRYPESWSLISVNTRRCLINRFPYGVIFQIKSDTIRIIAIANLHQKPGYWEDRV